MLGKRTWHSLDISSQQIIFFIYNIFYNDEVTSTTDYFIFRNNNKLLKRLSMKHINGDDCGLNCNLIFNTIKKLLYPEILSRAADEGVWGCS
jgi:hypothetical protein